MKRFLISIFLILPIFLSSCTQLQQTKEEETAEEIRAVWVSIYDLVNFCGIGEGGFRAKAENMFGDIKDRGFNHVFVQVRPCSDAMYPSKIFPWSKYISGEQGKSPGYDPLEIFLKVAHSNDLKLHAWINPYRISGTFTDIENLSEDNPAREMYRKNASDIYLSTDGIYYNPASVRVQKLILDGVREIVKNYDVDGIHIDDFFYPATSEEIDKNEFQKYKENNGQSDIQNFRIEQVNAFVSGMYSAVKNENKNIIVSISPQADIEADLSVHYADVEAWGNEKGFCDWLIPQVYYGMENETKPYKQVVTAWRKLVKNENVKLIIGLASYKCGETDLYAGKGRDEWKSSDNILSEQLKYLRKKKCDGFSLFSYNSLYIPNEQMKVEWENFKTLL